MQTEDPEVAQLAKTQTRKWPLIAAVAALACGAALYAGGAAAPGMAVAGIGLGLGLLALVGGWLED